MHATVVHIRVRSNFGLNLATRLMGELCRGKLACESLLGAGLPQMKRNYSPDGSTYFWDSGDMHIFVKTMTDNTTMLDVNADDTVRDVKAKLRPKTGLTVDQQFLIFKGNCMLDDSLKLCDYDVEMESEIHCLPNFEMCPGYKRIFAQTPRGKIIPMNVHDSDTIDNVKLKIQNNTSIPISRQRLLFANRWLEDGTLLGHYGGICMGVTIKLIIV